MKPSFTIGIEEEYQTIDPETRDLRSHIDMEIIAKGKAILKESVKPEMHQSVIEVGTGVCNDIEQARGELIGLRRDMIRLHQGGGGRFGPRRAECAWPPAVRIHLGIGASRRFTPTNAISTSWKT